MNISNQFYTRSRGSTVFGSNGLQQVYSQYNSAFNFISSLIPYDETVNLSIPQTVDSCWSSGNIYYSDSSNNVVRKMAYNHDELAELSVLSPTALSVIQTLVPMDDSSPTSVEEEGCWIIASGGVLKTDSNLNVEVEVNNLPDPVLVATNHATGGCYVVDNSFGLLSFDSNGDLIATGAFTDDHIIGCLSNSSGDLYLLTETELYRFKDNDGVLNIAATFSLSSYFGSTQIGCFDIDTSTGNIYVAGGNNITIKIVKFNSLNAYVSDSSASGVFPYMMRASQHPSSNTFYLLTDDSKIVFVESSSSESAGGGSSSSSSSSSSSDEFSFSSSSSSSMDSSSSSSDGFSTSSSSSSDGFSTSSSSSSEGNSSSSSEGESSSSSLDDYAYIDAFTMLVGEELVFSSSSSSGNISSSTSSKDSSSSSSSPDDYAYIDVFTMLVGEDIVFSSSSSSENISESSSSKDSSSSSSSFDNYAYIDAFTMLVGEEIVFSSSSSSENISESSSSKDSSSSSSSINDFAYINTFIMFVGP